MDKFLSGSEGISIENEEQKKNLLDALRYFTGKIVEQELNPKVPSHEFVSAMTGLVFHLLNEHLPKELIAFSRHAGRKVIKDEDLFLYCRKTSLQQHLRDYSKQIGKPLKSPRVSKESPDDGDIINDP